MSMIDAPADALPPLAPPAIVAPAPREVSFGLVAGTAPTGTKKIIVRVGEYVVAEESLARQIFSLDVPMRAGIVQVRVTAVDGRNRRSTRLVEPVCALPVDSRPLRPLVDPGSRADSEHQAARRQPWRYAGVYVQDLRTGQGAAWNARARFPAASTLKLAIAVTVLRSLDGKPAERPRLADLLAKMLVFSDNAAANDARGLARGLDVRRFGACQRDDARSGAARLAHVRRLRDEAACGPGG